MRYTKNLCLAAFMVIVFCSMPVYAVTLSIIAEEDTLVDSAGPTANVNTNFLRVFYESDAPYREMISYLKFDLSSIPDDAVISIASFSWFNYSMSVPVGAPTDYIDLFHVVDTWNETTMTWNTKPNLDYYLGRMHPNETAAYYTAYFINNALGIDNWNESIDLTDNALSVMLKTPNDSYTKGFYAFSREYTGNLPPYLYLEYSTPGAVPEPSTMILLGVGLFGLVGIARPKLKK